MLSRIFIAAFFVIVFIGIVAYARGYRLDFRKKTVTSTGILAISSNPKAAKVYINGELKGATDLNITLPPDRYTIEIKKEGYSNWTRELVLKGELVLSVDALLFPINPSLSPLTNLGVVKAFPIDQSGRVLLISDQDDAAKDGIYLFDASKKTFSLLAPLKRIISKANLPPAVAGEVEFSQSTLFVSPDDKQVVMEFGDYAYLLSLEEENTIPFDVSESKETLLAAWVKEKDEQRQKILETFPNEMVKIASDSFHIISFSPDETKMLYTAKKQLELPSFIKPPLIAANQSPEERNLALDAVYLYDKKEDKNFRIAPLLPAPPPNITDPVEIENWKLKIGNSLVWYPDSRHLLFVEKSRMAIMEYAGNGKQTVYSGPFKQSFFTTNTDGKIIVLINLNPEINKLPDLYFVGIR